MSLEFDLSAILEVLYYDICKKNMVIILQELTRTVYNTFL